MPTLELFTELAAIPSPPGDERAVADRVVAELGAVGVGLEEDDCGPHIGSTIGNLYGRVDGTVPGTPLFFCAHLDTVPPAGSIEPVVDDDGFVRNAAGTILGADNKAAVVAIVEAVRRVLAERRPHAGIELVFTPKEEVGLIGAKEFDVGRLTARAGYVYDMAAPIGTVILAAPSARKIDFRFHGRAAHSGMYPEEGRSAIAAAARAISDFRLGRLDDETTANVGKISGGTARNIVPEWCMFEAEARSLDDRKLADVIEEMLEAATFAASLGECDLETEVGADYKAYRFARDDAVVRLAVAALERTGHELRFETTGGAADANVFNERGLECLNLANGMTDIHTPEERIAVADLDAMVERHEGLVRLEVDGAACVAYPELTGPVALGDDVLVNVQARELELGSGGFDVLHANLTRGLELGPERRAHVMKLPYTSLQHAVVHGEEQSPVPDALEGMPVVACSLHSQLAPVCAALRGLRVAYVQLPGGALPVGLSDVVRVLKRELVLETLSVGACFGGDIECVNTYSALALACGHGADVAVCSIGPGIVGTATLRGHGGLAAGDAITACVAQGGRAVLALRISEHDPRERHRGVSHHSRAVLEQSRGDYDVAWPAGCPFDDPVSSRATTVDVEDWRDACAGLPLSHMGRGPDDDPWFFAASFAAGRLARTLIPSG